MKNKHADWLAISAANIRGQILNDTIYLERLMDEFLCRYFCHHKAKRKQLFELLMATRKITFDSKAKVLAQIIKKDFLSIYEKKMPTDFEYISMQRNIFAHELLDTSDDGIIAATTKGEMHFTAFPNGNKIFTQEIINDLDGKIKKYIKVLTKALEK